MTTQICFEILYGETSRGPVCSILQVGNFKILLDCGWDDAYDTELLKPIEKVLKSDGYGLQQCCSSLKGSSQLCCQVERNVRCFCGVQIITIVMIPTKFRLCYAQVLDSVDIVVISHPDPAHLGALPYLVGRLKLHVPVYATVPCHRMGQMFMYDQYLSRQQSSDFSIFSLDDVDAAFQCISHLKYQQQVKLTGMLFLSKFTAADEARPHTAAHCLPILRV